MAVFRIINSVINKHFYRLFKTKYILTNCFDFAPYSKVLSTPKSKLITIRSLKCLSYSSTLTKPYNDKTILLMQTENNSAHLFMEDIPSYDEFILKAHRNMTQQGFSNNEVIWSEIMGIIRESKPNDDCQNFLRISRLNKTTALDLEDERLREFVSNVVSSLPSQNNEMIFNILYSLMMWPPTPFVDSPNFKLLWKKLDNECCTRVPKLSLAMQLKISDCWYHLSLFRKVSFAFKMINFLEIKLTKLKNSEFIFFLFLLNLQRSASPLLMTKIEQELNKRLSDLSIEEISVAVMSFFKTQTVMNDSILLENIMDITIKNISSIDSYSLCSLLKHFRNSCKPAAHQDKMKALLIQTSICLERFEYPTLVHLCSLGTHILVYEPSVLNATAEIVCQKANHLRVKDISKIVMAICFYGHEPLTNIFNVAIKEFERPERLKEIMNYPSSLSTLLSFLAYKKIYSDELIDLAFSKNIISLLRMKDPFQNLRQLALLDCCIEIDHLSYTGNRMEPEMRKQIFQNTSEVARNKELTFQDKLVLNVCQQLRKRVQLRNVCCIKQILPHMDGQDVIVLKEKGSKQFKAIPEEFRVQPEGETVRPLNDDIWIVLLMCGRKFYSCDNLHFLGLSQMKFNQLETLGYKVVPVPWFSFNRLNETQKGHYLMKLIDSAIS